MTMEGRDMHNAPIADRAIEPIEGELLEVRSDFWPRLFATLVGAFVGGLSGTSLALWLFG